MHDSRHRRPFVAPLLALLLALGGLAAAPPLPAGAVPQIFTVTTLLDRDATCAPGNCSLREAIKAAETTADADTILFAPGLTGEIDLGSALPAITRSLTITGPGRDLLTVDGQDAVRPIYIDSGVVTIARLALARGQVTAANGAGAFGGCLATNVGVVTLSDMLIHSCKAIGQGGGAIVQSGGALTIERSELRGNTAEFSPTLTGGGGAIFIDQYSSDATLTIRDSTIIGNTATSSDGGAIKAVRLFDRPSAGSPFILAVNIERTIIGTPEAPNRSTNWGGGIYTNGAALSVSDSTIGGNRAGNPTLDGYGGGIYATGSTVQVTGSTIRDNRVDGTPDPFGQGGGLSLAGSLVTVTDSTVADNVVAGFGGGIDVDNGTLRVSGTTFSGNTAARAGGGLDSFGATTTVTNSTFSGNRAAASGGGLYSVSGPVTLAFVTITSNVADNDANGSGDGGGIGESDTIAVCGSIIAGNADRGGERPDCAGNVAPQGNNLVVAGGGCATGGTDIALPVGTASATILDPALANNGGPTRTHALVAGGPAVDAAGADCASAPVNAKDQRGERRPQGAGCDVGAYELIPASSPSPSPSASPSAPPSAVPTPSPTPSRSPSPSAPPTSFADVPADYWAHGQIIRFAQRGITTGCDTDPSGTRYYCPERPVTRAEMAAFLIRTLTGTTAAPAGPATPTFSDVPADHPQYGYIEALVKLGITTGCGGGDYCPDREVTRAEMAAFIIRAKTGSTNAPPGPATPTFGDVPPTQAQYGFIEEMARRQITTGCGDPSASPHTYCPDAPVKRSEMAVFIIRAYP